VELEILRLKEKVDIAIEVGESHFREFKSGLEGKPGEKKPRSIKEVCVDISRTLVAFANADGGELLVGVEDDGTVLGLDYTDSQINTLLEASKTHVHQDTPLPSGRATRLFYQDKTILFFSVPKGTEYIYLTSDGRCVQRKDRDSIPISAEKISFSRSEKNSLEYDRKYVDNADISDLDVSLVTEIAQQISKGMSPEKCLQHLELAEFDGERLRYKKAALLLFAKKPSKWHPRLQVRILKVNGTEIKTGKNYNVVYDDEVNDNILRLIESSWELIRPHLTTETRIASDAIFRTQIVYPELACREALINAIAHRDYSIEGRGIEVHVYSDRLEIISPGALLSSIQLEDLKELKGVHQSRNSLIARVLREIGYMRELGEGIRRIYELMELNDLTEPELYTDRTIFRVALSQKFVYTKEERIWLENFSHLNLDRDQKTVVRLGVNGRTISASEIWDAVGIIDTDYYRQLLESLRNLDVLQDAITRQQVITRARTQRIPKKQVPRYLIAIPSKSLTDGISLLNSSITKSEINDDEADYAQVYVGNIPFETEPIELMNVFSKYGDVVNVSIPRNQDTNKLKGYAFVEFERKDSASRAIYDSGKLILHGRKLYVNESLKKIKR
jgi:ATP-dependent DNA helicase RecG